MVRCWKTPRLAHDVNTWRIIKNLFRFSKSVYSEDVDEDASQTHHTHLTRTLRNINFDRRVEIINNW